MTALDVVIAGECFRGSASGDYDSTKSAEVEPPQTLRRAEVLRF